MNPPDSQALQDLAAGWRLKAANIEAKYGHADRDPCTQQVARHTAAALETCAEELEQGLQASAPEGGA